MEMHQLRYVVAVARAGNFSRAAEQCHVSQPSLSQQIQKLEHELGERLFDRLKRAAKLTPPGEAFLRRATRILDEVDAAKREASDACELLRGTLTIGVLPTIAPYLLPELLAEFLKKFPGVEIVLHEDTTARLLALMKACEIDLAIASPPIADALFEARELFAEELLVALPAGHRLAGKRSVSAADLRDERFIVMQEGHCLGDQVLNFCDHREVPLKIRFRSAQVETILSLVGAGMGVSIIPEMAAKKVSNRRVEFTPLTAPRPKRTIAAVWPRQRPPGRAAEQFLQLIASLSEQRSR
jgi:LysR family hydrogen peroxide-inducible transcriptional activator